MPDLGRTLILLGLLLVVAGLLVIFADKIPWIGRLPGDIYYKSDRVTFYFPIVTSLVVSVVLSLLFYLFRR
ncbi:MAG: DUF2905 domain-containing protein [Deltaproteobacteria bacterium]|nr:DUF2905 domain-containing protein [Deltaproteobacteria bacterium]